MRRIVVDLTSVSSEKDIHQAFASTLHFQDFSGANWDALWVVLSGFNPRRITIVGIDHLKSRFPDALSKTECFFSNCTKELGETAPNLTWR
ncbi:barstar family protein [Luteolibacter pohnpeiensis]|uniref:Barstar family protein n=1 Tax=Luteolibacter pohnpeiensis TaxID=454153 RepID=A0A934SDP5_9BACT|nr:barstar family protein [Luteolibacter pohnpeiensis]